MTKKLIEYAENISYSYENARGTQYFWDNKYFVTDGVRVLRMEDSIPSLTLVSDQGMCEMFQKFFSDVLSSTYDYKIHQLPSVEEIKEGIRGFCGRKLDKIVWSDGVITVNARFLHKTMIALNSKACYISSYKTTKTPIYFALNDDLNAKIDMLLLPVYNPNMNVGFWKVT